MHDNTQRVDQDRLVGNELPRLFQLGEGRPRPDKGLHHGLRFQLQPGGQERQGVVGRSGRKAGAAQWARRWFAATVVISVLLGAAHLIASGWHSLMTAVQDSLKLGLLISIPIIWYLYLRTSVRVRNTFRVA